MLDALFAKIRFCLSFRLIALFLLTALFGISACSKTERRFADGYCSIGTGELNTAFAHWSHNWQKKGKKVLVHEGRGSRVAPDALFKEICDLAPMARPMEAAEIHRFVKKYGDRPIGVPIAIEALAIVTKKEVPIEKIRWQDLQKLLGKTPATLGELFGRLPPSWHARELRVCGLNSASETYEWLRATILNGNYGDRILEHPDSLAILQALKQGKCNFAYLRPKQFAGLKDLKALAIELPSQAGFVLPTKENIQNGRYPLSRYYYIYLPPQKRPLRPLQETLDFLHYLQSVEAQSILLPLGLYPTARQERNQK